MNDESAIISHSSASKHAGNHRNMCKFGNCRKKPTGVITLGPLSLGNKSKKNQINFGRQSALRPVPPAKIDSIFISSELQYVITM